MSILGNNTTTNKIALDSALDNLQGGVGPQGPTGPQGPAGPAGPAGPTGAQGGLSEILPQGETGFGTPITFTIGKNSNDKVVYAGIGQTFSGYESVNVQISMRFTNADQYQMYVSGRLVATSSVLPSNTYVENVPFVTDLIWDYYDIIWDTPTSQRIVMLGNITGLNANTTYYVDTVLTNNGVNPTSVSLGSVFCNIIGK